MALGDTVRADNIEYVVVCDGSGVLPGVAIVDRELGASSLTNAVHMGNGFGAGPIDRASSVTYEGSRRDTPRADGEM
jgi:hypothetical protein